MGQVFPQPRFDDGVRLDDRVCGRFALLGSDSFMKALPQSLRSMAGQAGVQIVEQPSSEIDTWLREHDAAAVLLRPDAYVYALGRTAEDTTRAMAKLRDTLKPHARST